MTRAWVLIACGFWESHMKYLKTGGIVLGVLSILMGVVWVLQGVNVLPGSFMTGDLQWSYRGGALAVFGLVLLLVSMRKTKTNGS